MVHIDTTGHRPTWAEIDLNALAANFQIVRRLVDRDVKVMAVVKANAYGHGAVECARRLAAEGADWFGVALPEEGIELRTAGITQPILCLSGFWAGQQNSLLQHKLTPVVYRIDMFESLDRAAHEAGVIVDAHLKIDTGMGRLGARFDQLSEFVDALRRFKHIRVDGLMTHLAAADDRSCATLTADQIQRFENAVALLRERGYTPTWRHLANSAATFDQPSAWGNMVRPGGVLYGLWRDILPPARVRTASGPGSPSGQPAWGGGSDRLGAANDLLATSLNAVMYVRSRIALLKWVPEGETIGYGCTYETSRKTLVATLPIGYNDGYLRGLSNRGRVIVRGTYASVIGRVSMDLTLVDVTDVEGVQLGDVVTLLGRDLDDPDLAVSAEDIARTAGTLSYEVTCGISHRVPRSYL